MSILLFDRFLRFVWEGTTDTWAIFVFIISDEGPEISQCPGRQGHKRCKYLTGQYCRLLDGHLFNGGIAKLALYPNRRAAFKQSFFCCWIDDNVKGFISQVHRPGTPGPDSGCIQVKDLNGSLPIFELHSCRHAV